MPVEGRDGLRGRGADEPLRSQTSRLQDALVTPFIAELRGGGSTARPTSEPLATVVASGQHHALIAPYYGTARAAPASDPLGTITTRDRHALVMRNNTTRDHAAWACTPASDTLRTLTTSGHQSLITPGDLEAAHASVDDCRFRMLDTHEIAAGMAFPSNYLWDGTKRERVRMAGNAVTPPAARDLIAAVVEALSGETPAINA